MNLYADADSLVAVADRHRPKFRAAIEAGIRRVREQASLADIEDAYPIISRVQALYSWDEMLTLSFYVRKDETAAADDLISSTMRDAAKLTYQLDMVSPAVVDAAQRLAGNMVTSIDRASKAAIRDAVVRGVAGELNRRQVAELIRQTVGLTAPQSRALFNYQQSLEDLASGTGTRSQILGRYRLADRRWSQRTLTPDRVDRLVERYSERLIRHRAENIAISETIRASNAGRVASWEQAIRDGFLPNDALMVWRTVGDDRVCPECHPLDGQTVGVVGGQFRATETGAPGEDRQPRAQIVDARFPPLHSRCRCVVVLA